MARDDFQTRCTHELSEPTDPGRGRATELLITRYRNDRHTPERTCLGCGGTAEIDGPSGPTRAQATCSAYGAALYKWCSDCTGYRWGYQAPWAQIAGPRLAEDQLTLAL